MKNQDFTTTVTVARPPAEVFSAILDVRGWWSGLYDESFEGSSEKPGDEFSFLAGGGVHYSKQKMIEMVPDKRVVWQVTDSKLTFIEDTGEWTDTKISFDLYEEEGGTRVVFTHAGLTPESQCYDSCAPAWTQYVRDNRLNLERS